MVPKAAHKADGKLESSEYELGFLKPDEVDVDVEYCGMSQLTYAQK